MHNFTFGASIASCSNMKAVAHSTYFLLFSPFEMIDQATIDRILDAAQIVDVVSEFVTLVAGE